jgi:hypothetical protein
MPVSSILSQKEPNVTRRDAAAIVENFWREVWKAPQNPESIDRLVAEDFVITSGGVDIRGREAFKRWVVAFQERISELQFESLETFQNEDGTRVASRWRVTGKNNGFLGTTPGREPISMLGTAVFAVGDDGLLQHNWVERNAWEVYERLINTSA